MFYRDSAPTLQQIFSNLFTPAWPEIIKWINGELDEETKREYEENIFALDKKVEYMDMYNDGWDLPEIPSGFEMDDIKKGMIVQAGGSKGSIRVLVHNVDPEEGVYGWAIVSHREECYCQLGEDDMEIYDKDDNEWIVQTWNPLSFSHMDIIGLIGELAGDTDFVMEFMEEWIHGERKVEEPEEEYKKAYRDIFRKFKDSLKE